MKGIIFHMHRLAQWQPVLAAPHRGFFLSGAVQMVAVMAWWASQLAARVDIGAVPPWPWPPGWMHGILLIYGCFPFFVFGFLLTAMPRWQGAGETPPEHFLPAWGLMSAGALLLHFGLARQATLAPALMLTLAGWGWGLRALLRAVRGPAPDRRHARLAWLALAAGWGGVALQLAHVLNPHPEWLYMALMAGFWLFLLPLFVIVAHRMLPFFSASALPGYSAPRIEWPLYVLLTAFAAHFVFGQWAPRWLPLADAPAAAAALTLTHVWQWRRSLGVRLLAMLHLGFMWLGIGMTLHTLQGLLGALGIHALGLMPQHALGIGFAATMMLAMVTRVTLGHSGCKLAADQVVWRIYLGMHGLAVLRMAAELLPAAHALLVFAVSLLWLALMGAWAARHAPLYWRPRADGRPG